MAELNRRYVVMAMATEAPFDAADPDGVFVLKPWKDPAALRALMTYRENCYPELGRDLEAWIRAIEAGPVVRGDVGRRNEPHVKSVRSSARPARPRSARPSRSKAPAARGKKAPVPKAAAKRKKRRR
jgi:hypothetical protein